MKRKQSIFSYLLLAIFLLGAGLSLAAQQKPRGWVPPAPGAPQVGEKIPDFTLPDSHGASRTLAKLIAEADGGRPGWVLLVFYRGYW